MAEREALCARLCATAMTSVEKQALARLHEMGAGPVAKNAIEDFRAHNERFHNAIYRGSGNRFLEDVTVGVRRRLAPFRKMQFEIFRRIKGSQAEHARIVAAILSGDGDLASGAMRDHILTVRDKVDEAAARRARSSRLNGMIGHATGWREDDSDQAFINGMTATTGHRALRQGWP